MRMELPRAYTDNAGMLVLPPERWMARAACATANPDAWFPEPGGSTVAVKKVCASCPVRAECLAYALRNGESEGVWGGLSARQLRRAREKKNK